MLCIACQTAGPIGLKFFVCTHRWPGMSYRLKKLKIFFFTLILPLYHFIFCHLSLHNTVNVPLYLADFKQANLKKFTCCDCYNCLLLNAIQWKPENVEYPDHYIKTLKMAFYVIRLYHSFLVLIVLQ